MLLGLGNHHNLKDVRMVKMASNMFDKSVKPLTPMSDPLTPMSDQEKISLYNFNIRSSR